MHQSIRLLRGNGEIVLGLLCSMNLRHVEDIRSLWTPMLEAMNQEDAFWNWARKKQLALRQDGYEAYAIEYEELTQGVLWLETRRHRSQSVEGQPLVYVEAIASAPWNRRPINPEPYLRGLGSLLLQFARQRSLQLGYGGRIGLHSLAGSESFYESQNMMSGGPDPDCEGLVYFEYGLLYQSNREDLDNEV